MSVQKYKSWDYISRHFKKAHGMLAEGHANVPAELQACKAWVVWRMTYVTRDEAHDRWKFSKIPYYPTPPGEPSEKRNGIQGSDADRAKLGTYSDALNVAGVLLHKTSESHHTTSALRIAGVGIAMLPDLGLVAFDADSCIDADGNISPEVLELTDGTYAEISPCLLYTSPSPRDRTRSRMPSSA